jgi:hypothetical protein
MGQGGEVNKFLLAFGINFSSEDLRVFMNPLLVNVFPQYHVKLKQEVLGTLSGAVLRLQGSGNVTKPFCYPVT